MGHGKQNPFRLQPLGIINNTFQLIKLFQERVNQGQTIIMVTHDPEIIKRYPTRRLRVEDGCLKEMEGEHIV